MEKAQAGVCQCHACGLPIRWLKAEGGRFLSVDAKPDPMGCVVIEGGVARTLLQPRPGGPRYAEHVCRYRFPRQRHPRRAS